MSSGDHVSPQQLQMFMPAGELRQNIPNDYLPEADWNVDQSVEGMWERKLKETKSDDIDRELQGRPPDLHGSIASEGVKRPVRIHVEDGTILDGHHRIAAAADIDPKMEVPVRNIGRQSNPQAMRPVRISDLV